MQTAGNRPALIRLVEEICDPRLTDLQLAEKCAALESRVPHPAPCDLIFNGLAGRQLSPAEVVDEALGYAPIPG